MPEVYDHEFQADFEDDGSDFAFVAGVIVVCMVFLALLGVFSDYVLWLVSQFH